MVGVIVVIMPVMTTMIVATATAAIAVGIVTVIATTVSLHGLLNFRLIFIIIFVFIFIVIFVVIHYGSRHYDRCCSRRLLLKRWPLPEPRPSVQTVRTGSRWISDDTRTGQKSSSDSHSWIDFSAWHHIQFTG